MILDAQFLFDILISVIAVLFGWLYSMVRGEINEMKRNHKAVAEKLQAVEVEMPRSYVRKEDLERALDDLKKSLETIQGDVKAILKQRAN